MKIWSMLNKNRNSLVCNFIIALMIFVSPFNPVKASPTERIKIQIQKPIIHSTNTANESVLPQTPKFGGQDLYTQINKELQCLALNIYFEARSESQRGRLAVGHVVMNRVHHTSFPNSVCDVVRQGGTRTTNRCQFSWWCDGRTDRPGNQKQWTISLLLAFEIYAGTSQDPTHGALWYHADYVSPYWSRVFHRGPKIGRHIFYQENNPQGNLL